MSLSLSDAKHVKTIDFLLMTTLKKLFLILTMNMNVFAVNQIAAKI